MDDATHGGLHRSYWEALVAALRLVRLTQLPARTPDSMMGERQVEPASLLIRSRLSATVGDPLRAINRVWT